jgi:hypothetical protein
MTTSFISSVCFGIACIYSLIYGKVNSDHPLKVISFAIFFVFFMMGTKL